MEKFQSKPFYYKLWGDYALFTDPITRGGGEKFSYSVPTYQALKGITENLYWKPTLIIYIDQVKVMRSIRTQTNGIRTLIGSGGESKVDRSYYTYLKNVEYYVKFHFEWNELREDLKEDRDEIKHQEILLRTLDKGGRRDVFIGARECMGFVQRLTATQYEQGLSPYQEETINFGLMFHSFNYQSETGGEGNLESNFAQTVMEKGAITFIRPEECNVKNILGNYTVKTIKKEHMTFAKEELEKMK